MAFAAPDLSNEWDKAKLRNWMANAKSDTSVTTFIKPLSGSYAELREGILRTRWKQSSRS